MPILCVKGIVQAYIERQCIGTGIGRLEISVGIMDKDQPCLKSNIFIKRLFIVQHKKGSAQQRGAISVVAVIGDWIVRGGTIGQSRADFQLQVSIEKVKPQVSVQTVMFAQMLVFHVLEHKRKPPIGVIIDLLPFLFAEGFHIIPHHDPFGMAGDQMPNIGTVLQGASIEIIEVQSPRFRRILFLCAQQKTVHT